MTGARKKPKPKKRRNTPARVLADAAGLSIEEVSKRAGIGPDYFMRVARRGNAPEYLAQRLAHILGCDMAVFLYGLSSHTGAVGTPGEKRGVTTPPPRDVLSAPTTDGKSSHRAAASPLSGTDLEGREYSPAKRPGEKPKEEKDNG